MSFNLSDFGNHPLFHVLVLDVDIGDDTKSSGTGPNHPTRSYVVTLEPWRRPRRTWSIRIHVFVVDMPGLKSGEISVQVEDGKVLVVSGKRKREEKKDEVKYVKVERWMGKFMRKFVLAEDANTDAIKAVCQDGVLSVSVEKLPPPEPEKKPKTIQVNVA